jgi:hypothetical protein
MMMALLELLKLNRKEYFYDDGSSQVGQVE